MLIHLATVAVILVIGNVVFRHFEPNMKVWQRFLKALVILALTALISHYFGTKGIVTAFILALLTVIYVHGIWLPRHGVNGWTGEPKEKYYALRGWPPDQPR